MKINMNEKNEEKINHQIAMTMGRATAFVHSSWDALAACEEAERRLEQIGLVKAERRGCTMVHMLAGPWARSYEYSAAASKLHFVRGPKTWFLVEIEKARVFPQQAEYMRLALTGAQLTAGFSRLKNSLGIDEASG